GDDLARRPDGLAQVSELALDRVDARVEPRRGIFQNGLLERVEALEKGVEQREDVVDQRVDERVEQVGAAVLAEARLRLLDARAHAVPDVARLLLHGDERVLEK